MIQYLLRKVKGIPAIFYRRTCRFLHIFFIDIDENNAFDGKAQGEASPYGNTSPAICGKSICGKAMRRSLSERIGESE
jgi:hypothetical protein